MDFSYNTLRPRQPPGTDMRVWNVKPMEYTTVVSQADVVARSVRGYVIIYAGDATPQQGHMHLEPSPEKRAEGAWLTDVWYDAQTMTPTRVVWVGRGEFVIDARYATTDGVWLLSSIAVEARWRGRVPVAFSGEYSEYRFSTSPPDPRLAPAETRTPQPSPAT